MLYELKLFWIREVIDGELSNPPSYITAPMGYSPKNYHLPVLISVHPWIEEQDIITDTDGFILWEYTITLNMQVFNLIKSHQHAREKETNNGVCVECSYFKYPYETMVKAERDYADLSNLGWEVWTDEQIIRWERQRSDIPPDKPFLKRLVDRYPSVGILPRPGEGITL